MLANIAVVSISPDQDRSIRKCAILEVRSYASAVDLFRRYQLLAFFDIDAVSKDVSQLLPVEAETGFRGGNFVPGLALRWVYDQ